MLHYDAGRQFVKVRAVQGLAAACLAGALWAASDLWMHYGLRPADGGMLAPAAIRAAWAGGVATLGLGFMAGMIVYGRCYIRRIEDDGPHLRVTLAGTLRSFAVHVPRAAFRPTAFHDGHAEGHGLTVRAPWTTVRLPGRRLPCLLDLQGHFADEDTFSHFALGRPAPKTRKRG